MSSVMNTLWLLAQAPVSDLAPFLDYINLGVIVLVLWAIFTKKLVVGWAYEEKENRVEALEEQVNNLRDKIENDVLPQLFETTSVLSDFAEFQRNQRPR